MIYRYDYSRLVNRIREKFETMDELVIETGISRKSLSHKLSNKLGFEQLEINVLVEKLEIPKEKVHDYFFCKMLNLL